MDSMSEFVTPPKYFDDINNRIDTNPFPSNPNNYMLHMGLSFLADDIQEIRKKNNEEPLSIQKHPLLHRAWVMESTQIKPESGAIPTTSGFCEYAEESLALSLRRGNPIYLTHKGRVAGLVKDKGDASFYATETIKDLGIVAGAWFNTGLEKCDFDSIYEPSIPMGEFTSSIAHEYYLEEGDPVLKYARPTSFLIPLEAKREIPKVCMRTELDIKREVYLLSDAAINRTKKYFDLSAK